MPAKLIMKEDVKGMNIDRYVGGLIRSNGYVIYHNEGGQCYVIDPGYKAKRFIDDVRSKRLIPKGIIFTHHHYDHTGAADEVEKELGCPAFMEDQLDDIEVKDVEWKQIVRDFYGPFSKELKVADEKIEKIEFEDQITDEKCDKCGKPMAIKHGRFGDFLACTGYPECKNTKPIVIHTGVNCPECGKEIVQKRSRNGRIFFGCSGYPDCKVSFWNKPVNEKCPKCGSLLVERKTKTTQYACSNRECDYKK